MAAVSFKKINVTTMFNNPTARILFSFYKYELESINIFSIFFCLHSVQLTILCYQNQRHTL